MNLAAFEAFVKVMEMGSISLAADQLCITQPAVTKRIHSIEEYFNVSLFESAGRGIQPTPVAQELLPKVKSWLNELGDIHHNLSHQHQTVQGSLKFGTSHHIGLHHLPSYLKNYVQTYPQVSLDVKFVDSEQAHEHVLNGDLSIAFLTLPPHLDERLSYIAMWEDPLVFVAAPFHPLAKMKNLTLSQLLLHTGLLPAAKTYTSQITLAEFEKHGLRPKFSMSTNPLESIRMLTSIGLGWSVLPKTLINQDLKPLDIDIELKRTLGMVWHPGRSQSKAAETLIQFVQAGNI